ncbi:hypothetical protein ES708_14591 [subsurface metagenome]
MKLDRITLHMVVINKKEPLAIPISDHLKSIGYTVSESLTIDEVMKFIQNKPMHITHLARPQKVEKMNSAIHRKINTIAAKSPSIIVVSEDLQCLMIAQNKKHRGLANQPTLAEIEREYISSTLELSDWKYKTTAKILGIDRSTLYRKMKKYGISKSDEQD